MSKRNFLAGSVVLFLLVSGVAQGADENTTDECPYGQSERTKVGAAAVDLVVDEVFAGQETPFVLKYTPTERASMTKGFAIRLATLKTKYGSDCAAIQTELSKFVEGFHDVIGSIRKKELELRASIKSLQDANCDFMQDQGAFWMQIRRYLQRLAANRTKPEGSDERGELESFSAEWIDGVLATREQLYETLNRILSDKDIKAMVAPEANFKYVLDACFGADGTKNHPATPVSADD